MTDNEQRAREMVELDVNCGIALCGGVASLCRDCERLTAAIAAALDAAEKRGRDAERESLARWLASEQSDMWETELRSAKEDPPPHVAFTRVDIWCARRNQVKAIAYAIAQRDEQGKGSGT